MNLLRFFRRAPAPQTAPAARERLQILLTHERSSGSQPDLVAVLREEILAVVGRHVKIDPSAVEVRVDRGKDISTLEIEVEVPFVPSVRGATASAVNTATAAHTSTAAHKKHAHKKRRRAA